MKNKISFQVSELSSSSNMSIDNLELPKQNISAIINNPNLGNSYFSQLKNAFERKKHQKTITKSKKTGEDFTFLDIVQSSEKENERKAPLSSRSKLSVQQKCKSEILLNVNSINQKRQKLILKSYLKSNFDEYLLKIKKVINFYKQNHEDNGTTIYNNDKEISDKNKDLNYTSNVENLMKNIEQNFKVDTENYKIESEILEKPIEKIQSLIPYLIERSGYLEVALDRVIDSKVDLYLYLKKHYPFVSQKVDFYCLNIAKWKELLNKLKKLSLNIHAKLILNRAKRNNLLKIKDVLEKLKDISIIIKNKDRIQEGEEIITKLTKLTIVSDIITQYSLMISQNNQGILKDVDEMVSEILSKSIVVQQVFQYEEFNEDYDIERNFFEEIMHYNSFQSSDKIKNYFHFILIKNQDTTQLLKKITCISKFNFTLSYKTQFQKIFISKAIFAYDKLITDIDELKKKNNILYLFYIFKVGEQILKIIKENILAKIVDKETLIQQSLEVNLNERIQERINQKVEFIFKDNDPPKMLNNFIQKEFMIKKIFNIFSSLSPSNYNIKLQNKETEYIKIYCREREIKITEGIQLDSFNLLNSLPYIYQSYIDKICNFDISSIDSYQKAKDFFNLEKEKQIKDPIKYIEFRVNNEIFQMKPMSTSLDIILYTFETLQMLSYFSVSNYIIIINSLFSIYEKFLLLNQEIILYEKGQIAITQNEIASVYTNIKLIQNLINVIYINDKFKLLNQFTKQTFNQLRIQLTEKINSLINQCEKKIDELIKIGCINLVIDEFSQINFENYPVISEEENSKPFNPFTYHLIQMVRAIVNAMDISFPKEFIQQVFISNLDIFVLEIEKILKNVKDINGEEEKKQFKKDLLCIKKNINNGLDSLGELKDFKAKISKIVKKYYPEKIKGLKGEKKDK